jgi:putative serine protease PepD
VLPALSRGQRIERPFLGVTTAAHPDGAEIVTVTAGSPADDAGLQPGEVITRVDGRTVSSPDDVAQAISTDKPGDTVQVELTGAQNRTVDVQLGTRP